MRNNAHPECRCYGHAGEVGYLDGEEIGIAGMRGAGESIITNMRCFSCEAYRVATRYREAHKAYYSRAIDEVAIFNRALNMTELRQLAGR